MVPPADSPWRVMRPRRLRLRRFDDEAVLYDDRSGDTHLLDDLSARVLERLLRGRAGTGELVALATHAGGADDPARMRVRVVDVLGRLRRLGIAKPVRK